MWNGDCRLSNLSRVGKTQFILIKTLHDLPVFFRHGCLQASWPGLQRKRAHWQVRQLKQPGGSELLAVVRFKMKSCYETQ